MSDIFISYAREDREQAKGLATLLEAKGWAVWWDVSIRVGNRFDEVIEAELNNARCVVVLWSKHSINSKWVRAEAHEADSRNILFPVLIDRVEPPLGFRQIHWADLTQSDENHRNAALQRLIDDILLLLGTPPNRHTAASGEGAATYEAPSDTIPRVDPRTFLTESVGLSHSLPATDKGGASEQDSLLSSRAPSALAIWEIVSIILFAIAAVASLVLLHGGSTPYEFWDIYCVTLPFTGLVNFVCAWIRSRGSLVWYWLWAGVSDILLLAIAGFANNLSISALQFVLSIPFFYTYGLLRIVLFVVAYWRHLHGLNFGNTKARPGET
jgi:hypothetical protein